MFPNRIPRRIPKRKKDRHAPPIAAPRQPAAKDKLPRRALALALLFSLSLIPSASAAPRKTGGPEFRISFEQLGIPGVSAAFLKAGGSLLTVHFVDPTHLLVTFGSRGLVPRLPNDPPGDRDRLVTAELIELPSAKILTRTEWHLHDHGRYLWSIGEGRFLFRERNSLSVLAPLANLSAGEPWQRVHLPHKAGVIQGVMVSPDNHLVTVETSGPVVIPPIQLVNNTHAPDQGTAAAAVSASGTMTPSPEGDLQVPQTEVTIEFFRVSGRVDAGSPFEINHAGALKASKAVRLPITADGYLLEIDRGHSNWDISFETFSGRHIPLAPLGSTCPPGLQMVSPSQMLAFTCRSLAGGVTLAAYDFDKHEIWEEPLGDLPAPPAFAFAPSAGRVALSRILPGAPGNPEINQGPGDQSQELRVYQTQTGDLLLKVNCNPLFRVPENFDLSEDGMRAAVVRNNAIEIYRLPELTKLDRNDLQDLAKLAPPHETGPVNLSRMVEEQAAEADLGRAEAPGATVAGATAVSGTVGATPPPPANAGDVATQRKPPTLLKPGEKPEFQAPATPPQ